MDLQAVEQELKKRIAYPYRWPGKQQDAQDAQTGFIYKIQRFEELLTEIQKRFGGSSDYPYMFNYSLNRWLNFWSAKAVEHIFCSLPGVVPALNERDKLVDFEIHGVRFDHKTSVFPRTCGLSIEQARNQPRKLIRWLYEHQSREQRKHLKNRLFIVLCSKDGNHWKLKTEIGWLKGIIENYVAAFEPAKLERFSFEETETTLSDIIWAVK